MPHQDKFRKVSNPEEIPNPGAPILSRYMKFYSCDIVTAYNIRMGEVWEYYELTKTRYLSKDDTEKVIGLEKKLLGHHIEIILSHSKGLPQSEIDERINRAKELHESRIERIVKEREEHATYFLTPEK